MTKKMVDGDLVDMTQEEEDAYLASVTLVPTAAMVKAEAQRRIVALTGAEDMQTCIVRQLNASMRATELNDLRLDRDLTPTEQAEAAALRGRAAAIKAIRARSNALEAMTPIPSDYTDDTHWA